MATATLPALEIVPGQLAPFDYSPEENTPVEQEEQTALTELCSNASQRDMASRRWEVEQSWEARLFDRGYQFLLPRKGGGWQLPGNSTAYGPYSQQVASMYETNIYTPYEQIIVSALTRQIPKVRFEPDNPDDDGDITAAEAAEDYRKVFSRNNDLKTLHTDMARYLWTDGRAAVFTRYVKDAQRFGYEEQEESVVPEDESQSPVLPNTQADGGQDNAGISGQPGQTPKQPKGREVVNVYGKLEVKVPMNTSDLSDCHFLQFSKEYDISIAKAMFPDIEKKIQPSAGPGENELDRIARINCSLALAASYVTGDAMVKDVTVQRCWLRPAAFMDCKLPEIRDSLLAKFPEGCLVVHAGKAFAFARPECMDDHWTLLHAMPGDSQNRAGLGSWLISLQKRVNNWIDLMNDFFIRTVPSRYADSEAFNIDALRSQTNTPGNWVSFTRQPGVPFAELMGTDPAITHQSELPAFIEKFINELSQLLSGGYPALAGGDTEGNDTASGIAMQRDQALGRLASVWHSIQGATANYHRQAVMCAARCRESDIKESVPGSDALIVELDDLKGNVLCFPEADSNFPESWTERQGRFTALLQESKNPFVQQLLSVPKNMKVAKDAVGLTDFEIPQADSVDKQLGEFEVLMKSGPMPNPKLVEAEQKIPELQAQGIPPDKMAQLTQVMQSIPKEVSTVPIDEQFDIHEVEYQTCVDFINSPKGRKMKNGSDEDKAAIDNIKTHAMEHFAVMQKNAKGPATKPPSESINFKDLPADGQVQLAGQAGIKLDEQKLLAAKAAELATKSTPQAGAIQ